MFYLFSGSAASGKTTIARRLPARLPNLPCHDHDEKAASNADERCEHLEEWVQLALSHQQNGSDFLLTSHSPLGELLACPSAPKLNGIAPFLLDCHDTIRIQRMRDRGVHPDWPISQHVLNWAAWHRIHAWDPQWEQSVIIGNGPASHAYDRWASWAQGDKRWCTSVIDSSNLSVDVILDQLVEIVEAPKTKRGPLSAEMRWWE